MEELLPIIIILVVSGIVSTLKKSQTQKASEEHRWNTTSAQAKTSQAHTKTTAKAAPAKSMSNAPMSRAGASGRVMKPTVHTHMEPDCEIHDAAGSLGFVSAEGRDPCHEPQLTHVRDVSEEVPQEGGLTFDWTGDSMVKAVVMQEVLTRPCQRRTR